MTEHSDLGPSSLSRILACPGSYALSRSPEVKALGGAGRSSVYAARGTVAHRVAEALLEGRDPPKGIVTHAGYDIDVDDALVDSVRVYFELCDELGAVADWVVTEQRVSLDPYWVPDKPPVPVFGTSDFICYHHAPRRLIVADYKHGSGVVVNAAQNPQLFAYAAGALLIAPGPVATVDMFIVQPNAPGNPVKHVSLPVMAILQWVHDVLLPGIRRVEREPETYVAGSQCRFCPAAPLCPLLHQRAQTQAVEQFAEVD